MNTYITFHILQFFLMFPTNIMYSGVTCFFLSSSLCGIIQVKVLQHQMQTVTEGLKSNQEIDAKLDILIRSHTRIAEYVRDLDNLLAYPCLVEFLTFAMNILSLLFAITTVIIEFDRQNKIFGLSLPGSCRLRVILCGSQQYRRHDDADFYLVLARQRVERAVV